MAKDRICSVEGCGKHVMCLGWCSPHYYKLRTVEKCKVDGCYENITSKGLCSKHYTRFTRNGAPEIVKRLTKPGETIEWLKNNVGHADHEACLAWPFATNSRGYGVSWYRGKYVSAHRLMCIMKHGEPPAPKMIVAHSCGNGHRACVNPCHLRWATHRDNHLDAIAHGTHSGLRHKGCAHFNSRFSEQDLSAIRLALQKGERVGVIARNYGVVSAVISNIKSGRTYADKARDEQAKSQRC